MSVESAESAESAESVGSRESVGSDGTVAEADSSCNKVSVSLDDSLRLAEESEAKQRKHRPPRVGAWDEGTEVTGSELSTDKSLSTDEKHSTAQHANEELAELITEEKSASEGCVLGKLEFGS